MWESCVFRETPFLKVKVGLYIVILQAGLPIDTTQVGGGDLFELLLSFGDALLHEEVGHEHQAVVGAPSLLGSHHVGETHVRLSQVTIEDPSFLGGRGLHTFQPVGSGVDNRVIV